MKQTHQKGSYADYLNRTTDDISNKRFVFRLIKKNSSSSIMSPLGLPIIYTGSYTIPNVSTIMEKNREGRMVQRIIRYLPGESSIYKDEQSPDKDVPKKTYKLTFINGRMLVQGNDILKLEFLMKCNQNTTNPNRKVDVRPVFELEDNTVAVSKEIAKDKLISEVTNWCWNGEWDEVKAYARVLNVDLEQSPDEVRHNLKVIAMRDPQKFTNERKNPSMRKKHYVLEAIDRGYLIQDPASNSIAWANNPYKPLAVAAVGLSPVDVLVQKLATEEGTVMYNTIVDLLTPEQIITTELVIPSAAELREMKAEKTVVLEPVPAVAESDAELLDLVEQSLQLGLIVFKSPMWYSYKGENFKKKEGFVEGIKKNPRILKSLRYEIEKAKQIA